MVQVNTKICGPLYCSLHFWPWKAKIKEAMLFFWVWLCHKWSDLLQFETKMFSVILLSPFCMLEIERIKDQGQGCKNVQVIYMTLPQMVWFASGKDWNVPRWSLYYCMLEVRYTEIQNHFWAVTPSRIYFKFRSQYSSSGGGYACCASYCRFSCFFFNLCWFIFDPATCSTRWLIIIL